MRDKPTRKERVHIQHKAVDREVEQRFVLAGTRLAKTRGLLFTRPHDKTLLLMPCNDIHTVGMRHHLDVAFLDADGRVLQVHQNVGPFKRLRNRRAVAVLERFTSCRSAWYEKGDVVLLGCKERG
ncbi:DUF192 domain-containing protein [Adlercreutzia agrestimuris]|uniref:DUF192 domain-containing protein n=1 Tax=Adlercreutzia agrestimuris TaxID=2941324 RepID=UPI00203F3675|nr:DUF192 domain-containing protein [Adlercreutzia agrestimuris]